MRKIFSIAVLSLALIFLGNSAYAQYEQGDKLLNVGLNLGGTYGGSGVGVGASYEQGIHDFISVGAQVDLNTWNYGFGNYSWKYSFLTIGARGSYHFGKHFVKNDKLDLYAGPALGYRITSYKTPDGYNGTYSDSFGGGVFFGAFVGARYYFKPNLGAFAELGDNTSALKVGVALKF